MNSIDNSTQGFSGTLSAIGSSVLRVAVATAVVVFMFVMLFIGLVLGLALMAYALLRGRRPVGLIWRGANWSGRFARPRGHPAQAARGEVVDIEAREVAPNERREG